MRMIGTHRCKEASSLLECRVVMKDWLLAGVYRVSGAEYTPENMRITGAGLGSKAQGTSWCTPGSQG